MATKDFGKTGEEVAIELLKQNGYKVVAQNFKCKLGEVDVIALNNDTLVFVEVKARWSRKFGPPEAAVNDKKLHKIKRVGEYFLKLNPSMPKKQRIDVVALSFERGRLTSTKIIKVL